MLCQYQKQYFWSKGAHKESICNIKCFFWGGYKPGRFFKSLFPFFLSWISIPHLVIFFTSNHSFSSIIPQIALIFHQCVRSTTQAATPASNLFLKTNPITPDYFSSKFIYQFLCCHFCTQKISYCILDILKLYTLLLIHSVYYRNLQFFWSGNDLLSLISSLLTKRIFIGH